MSELQDAMAALKDKAEAELPTLKAQLDAKVKERDKLNDEISGLRNDYNLCLISLGRVQFSTYSEVEVDEDMKVAYLAALDDGAWKKLAEIRGKDNKIFSPAKEQATRDALLKDGKIEEKGEKGSYRVRLKPAAAPTPKKK